MDIMREFIGKKTMIQIDRPLGSVHPKYPDFVYPVNYGFVPGTLGPDGEEIDAYVLGVKEPRNEFFGTCIAIIHRTDDDDDKLIVVPDGTELSDEDVRIATDFQERFFTSEIIR
jgi:inorganic pyrophosphatase